jgi:hypothetical protein
MRRLLIGLLALAFAPAALAQPAHAPHEHGVAELRVGMDGQILLVEFESPLDNLVGFESAPRTKAQRDALAAAEQQLTRFEGLFILPAAAACTVKETKLHLAGSEADDDHDHDHSDKDDHGGTHSDMQATYQLQCAAPQALTAIEVKVFDAFPRTFRIRAEIAIPRGQNSLTLSPSKRTLPL